MLNVLSLFSGIGAFERALENLGIAYKLVGYCEIDKYASKAYSLLHRVPESMNYGDITKIDETQLPNNLDLITYGFPCQDISIAGEKKGLVDSEGKKTRSGLFFDALRIIEATRPKIAIAENVKHLTSKSMKPVFDIVLKSLEEAGYEEVLAELRGENGDNYEKIADGYRGIAVDTMNDLHEVLMQPRLNRKRLEAIYENLNKNL